jgi:excisionase family DNA binding protein
MSTSNRNPTKIPFSQRPVCTIQEAQQVTGLGHTKIYELIKDKRLKSKKVDGRRLVDVPSLIEVTTGGEG